MDEHVTEFLVFSVFSLGSLVAGYAARRAGMIPEAMSRTLHFGAFVWVWPLITLLSVWPMQIDGRQAWLLLISPALVIVPALVAIPIAKLIGLDRPRTGAVAVAAGLSNTGSTLGATLAYTLQSEGEARLQALGVGLVMLNLMLVTGILVMYPLAQHFGRDDEERPPIGKLIRDSFIDIRALGLYVIIIAFALNFAAVPFPQSIKASPLLTILIYVSALLCYAGIGLRLRLGDSLAYWREHLLLVFLKFGLCPLMVIGILALLAVVNSEPGAVTREVILIESAMPTAITSVMIANLFHLDARLASVAWVWNTAIFLVLPLPILLWYFG